MVTIVNENTTTFSINGIEYLKNFMSIVETDNVKILNVYDSTVVLQTLTNYADYTVDGSSYASAILLQSALLNVLYSRDSIIPTNETGYHIIQVIADFNTLVSNGTAGTWLFLNSVTMTASKTIPADVEFEFRDTQLNLGGFTLTGTNTMISAEPKQIFDISGTFTGTWNIDGFYFEWFGAKGDDSTSDSVAIEKSLNYGGSLVKGVKDKIYLLDAQITIPTAVDIEIDLGGGTLKRDSAYTTAESVFSAASATSKSVSFKNGFISDGSGVTDKFITVSNRLNFTLSNISAVSEGGVFETFDISDVKITNNTLENLIAVPLSGSTLGEINNGETILVENNTTKNTYNSFAVNAITSGECVDVKVLNNSVLKAYNTGIFCRMLGTGGNAYKSCIIDGNYLEDIGKSGIKFSSPIGNQGAMSGGRITNNHIRGFGLQVTSAGIAVFRDITDTLTTIENIIISGNIVDGYDTSGAESTIDNIGQRGIRCSYVDYLTVSDNIVRNCVSDGIAINLCNYAGGSGNVVENCCLGTAGVGGVRLVGVNDSTLEFISRFSQNTTDGIYIEQCRNNIISGVYSDNTRYGLNETTAGASGFKSGINIYTAIAKNNTTQDFIFVGENNADRSFERGCMDTDGDRSNGTTARRDSLSTNDWGNGRMRGFMYWNTTNNDIEAWNGTAWVKANGTAVDS